MKNLLLKLIFLLSFTSECHGMEITDILSPPDRYRRNLKKLLGNLFFCSIYSQDTEPIQSLIFEYSLILIQLKNTMPSKDKDLKPDALMTLETTPNLYIIDLKYFLARKVQIKTQQFRLVLDHQHPETDMFEANPLALVTGKMPMNKVVYLVRGPPAKAIKPRSCEACLHKIAYLSRIKIAPNRFDHSPNCPWQNLN